MKLPHMKDSIISRIAVIVLAIVMGVFGIYHFQHAKDMITYLPDFLPGGIIWVYLVGVAFIIVAIALITHKYVKMAGYLLAILLLVLIIAIRLPNWLNAGVEEERQLALTMLLKDLAIAAFAAYVASNAQRI
jgi:putative oxidoreductase